MLYRIVFATTYATLNYYLGNGFKFTCFIRKYDKFIITFTLQYRESKYSFKVAMEGMLLKKES